MENIQNGLWVPSISLITQGFRRAPFNENMDAIQEYTSIREIPISEHMFAHIEVARLDIVEALRSVTVHRGSHMFPEGSGIRVPSTQNVHLVDESYSLKATVRLPESDDDRMIFHQAVTEAQRRHHEL